MHQLKTAKISNFWRFCPVILLILNGSQIRMSLLYQWSIDAKCALTPEASVRFLKDGLLAVLEVIISTGCIFCCFLLHAKQVSLKPGFKTYVKFYVFYVFIWERFT